jgi:hypothetical protein
MRHIICKSRTPGSLSSTNHLVLAPQDAVALQRHSRGRHAPDSSRCALQRDHGNRTYRRKPRDHASGRPTTSWCLLQPTSSSCGRRLIYFLHFVVSILADVETARRVRLLTVPLFLATVTVTALAFFNYQKQTSSVVASTLYSLRVHPAAREVLGSEIQFKSRVPLIWGTLDQLHGNIDIQYAVKGTKGDGMMRFKSTRKGRMALVRYIPARCWMCSDHSMLV